jgi:MSHA biogenesis protein MshP
MKMPMNMPRTFPPRIAPSAASGFSLVGAIFLLVVLALLSAAIVSVVGTHQASSALDVQGVRAYQAARAGIEWGLYRQLQPASPVCFATSSFALPSGSSLSGFTVTVSCTLTNGPGTLKRWQLTSIACNQPFASACPNQTANPDYVQRTLQVEF